MGHNKLQVKNTLQQAFEVNKVSGVFLFLLFFVNFCFEEFIKFLIDVVYFLFNVFYSSTFFEVDDEINNKKDKVDDKDDSGCLEYGDECSNVCDLSLRNLFEYSLDVF